MTPEAEPEIRKPTPGAAKRRLTGAQWVEVVAMIRANVPVDKIAKAFKVKRSTIYRGLKKRGINLAAYQAVATEVQESAERRELIEKIRTTRERDYKHIDLLQQLSMNHIAEAKRDKRPYASIADDIKTLKTAIDAIGNGTKIKWMILGLDKATESPDMELPELPIREMTQDEVLALRDRQILEDENISSVEVFDDDESDEDAEGVVEEGGDDPPGT
jgi:predicted DNA-binding protein YlxM (UPF0122 family)